MQRNDFTNDKKQSFFSEPNVNKEPNIQGLLLDIEYIILEVKSRNHLFSSESKIFALRYLQKTLLENINKKGNENLTLGHYLTECLQQEMDRKKTILDVLLKPLTPTIGDISDYFFKKSTAKNTPPKSLLAIYELIEKYKDIPMPSLENIVENNDIHSMDFNK